jgi:hypothetical protein
MQLYGETRIDYFNMQCGQCKGQVKIEYMGWDPAVPYFRATCPTCKASGTFKVHPGEWCGLPPAPHK